MYMYVYELHTHMYMNHVLVVSFRTGSSGYITSSSRFCLRKPFSECWAHSRPGGCDLDCHGALDILINVSYIASSSRSCSRKTRG